jgi:hypothetical protein
MTPTDFVAQLVLPVAFSSCVSGSIVWFAREWISEKLKNSIKSQYDLLLETHKAQLKANAEVELEKLRAQLSLVAKQQEIVFSRLHERQAEVIAEVYAKLKHVQRSLSEYTKAFELAGEKPRSERGDDLVKSHNEFFSVFTDNAIFLPADIAEKIDAINRNIVRNGTDFTFLLANRNHPLDVDKWIEINKECERNIPAALATLEREFRSLLGYKGDALG